MIVIYTDGSCSTKTKKGGTGVVVFETEKNNKMKMLFAGSHRYSNTTNNRMEMMAMLEGLKIAKKHSYKLSTINSDSAYCVTMFNSWIHQWAKNDWTKYDGNPVMNEDLVKQFWEYAKVPQEEASWKVAKVKGHSSYYGNELADAIATNNMVKFNNILKMNNIEYIGEPTIIDCGKDCVPEEIVFG